VAGVVRKFPEFIKTTLEGVTDAVVSSRGICREGVPASPENFQPNFLPED
jgi:hypothetical protein